MLCCIRSQTTWLLPCCSLRSRGYVQRRFGKYAQICCCCCCCFSDCLSQLPTSSSLYLSCSTSTSSSSRSSSTTSSSSGSQSSPENASASTMLRPHASVSRTGPPRAKRSSLPLPNPAAPKQLYLNASEVATAAGPNPHRRPTELLLKSFQKQHPQQYAAAKARVLAQPGPWGPALQALHGIAGQVVTATKSSQLMQLATENDTAATHAVERAAQLFEDAQRSSRTLNALRQAAAAAAAAAGAAGAAGEVPLPEGLLAWPSIASTTEIRAAAPNAPDDAVAAALEVMYLERATGSYEGHINEDLQNNVNLQRGSKGKPAALTAAAEAAGQPIVMGDKRMYYADIQLDSAAEQQQQPGMCVKIGGRVDGWLEDRSAFVQGKNRQFKLLNGVPVHERVQVLAYMQCTGVLRCLFLEKYKNSSSTEQLIWEEDRCRGLWQQHVLPGLREYVQQLQELLRSTAAQDELLLTAYERGLIEW